MLEEVLIQVGHVARGVTVAQGLFVVELVDLNESDNAHGRLHAAMSGDEGVGATVLLVAVFVARAALEVHLRGER